MTQVLIDLRSPKKTGTDAPMPGKLDWVPSRRHKAATHVVIPNAFQCLAGEVVTVAPSTSEWAWVVTERLARGGVSRVLAVPDSLTQVNYKDLVEVDKATLDPIVLPPSTQALLDQATTDAAGAVVSAATATTKAGEASTSAANAAASASTAGSDATVAARVTTGALTGVALLAQPTPTAAAASIAAHTAALAALPATYSAAAVGDADPAAYLAAPASTPCAATIADAGAATNPGWLSRDRTTLFAIIGSVNLRYSVDDGATWLTHSQSLTYGVTAVRDLADGEILVAVGGSAGQIGRLYRSTGWATNKATSTFAQVHTASADGVYFHNSWSLFAYENIVLAGEYGPKTVNANARFVYLSTDYGQTWATVYDIGGTAETHVHGVAYDRWWNRLWISHGDITNRVLYSDDMGATWTAATYTATTLKNQVTTIFPMPDCVLFLSDSAPNGVLRVRRTSRAAVAKVEPAFTFDAATTITHIGQTAYQADYPGAPVLLAFTNDSAAASPGPGRLLATTDGFRFFEMWKDSISYGGAFGGLGSAVGPTLGGKYVGYLKDTRQANYSKVTVTAPAWTVPEGRSLLFARGDETFPRLMATGDAATISGRLALTYLTATKTEDITKVEMFTATTGAGATPTLVRFGAYEVDDAGNLTLVASTVSNTGYLSGANTRQSRTFSAPFRKIAGRRYAIGVIIVTAAAVPTMAGITTGGSIRLPAQSLLDAPTIAGQVLALADLPTTVAVASVVATGTAMYGTLLV